MKKLVGLLTMLYICTGLYTNIFYRLEVIEETRFHLENTKGHNSVIKVQGIMFLVFC